MELQLEDNVKAHLLMPDGTFEKPDRRGKQPINSQLLFCQEAVAAARAKREEDEEILRPRVFIPVESR